MTKTHSSGPTALWLELVQLVPIVTLALPFIAAGSVDLASTGPRMLLAALLVLPASALVLWKNGVLNPILLGTGLWLWVSAVTFLLPPTSLLAWLRDAQAAGLFTGVVVVGIGTTLFSPQGFIGARHPGPRSVRGASLLLLGLALAALGCSWLLRHDIRIGGGLPFVALNVARRVLLRRLLRVG